MAWSIDGVTYDTHEAYVAAITAKEREAFNSFREYLEENADLLSYVARQGDGEGGALIIMLKEVLFGPPVERERQYRKIKIGAALRTAVFERDMYRCLRCGDHRNLRADHIRPEVEGGEAVLDNLQTLCHSCNSWKGTKTIDFRRMPA